MLEHIRALKAIPIKQNNKYTNKMQYKKIYN